ncbi:MAG: CBS domain-containing protein [Proteobacteria bacterium]|nr:CBS domain-containing protein [Pseudomonadota bacterium]MBU1450307.1 CBS domain-containing protein [Pseudomonadota bacterium]MBU2467137.1 CBS domain-containing protein [Pseudomonadota bacterium]
MEEFHWQRILEFIRTVAPFDGLPQEDLERAVSAMEVAYFPRDTVILEQGGPSSQFLYFIQSGSARVGLPGAEDGGGELLVDERGEGDTFGGLSLLQGGKAMFRVTAREDLICYLLPAADFKQLCAAHPVLERHYGASLARNLQAVREQVSCELPAVAGLEGLSLSAAMVRSRVRELMSPKPVTCLPAMPVKAAARIMTQRQVGSMVVAEEGGHPLGILTDTDFRVRVMLRARSLDEPVAEFMSTPPHTIGPDAYAFEALLAMSHHGVHHLVVVENGRVVGIISDRDLQAITGGSPVGVVRAIDHVDSVDELVKLHPSIDRVVELLLRMGGSAREMLALVTEFNDRVTMKLIELTEEDMYHGGAGRPPVPYCWMALGSEGRREQTLRTDQDNALIFANVPGASMERVKGWFLGFSERIVDGLERCGFPRCTGGVMASNPDWCQSEAGWHQTFLRWVNDPKPVTLRLGSIFFDFREIYAEADYLEALRLRLKEAIEGNRLFLRFMAANSLYNRPPLGFLRQFVVEKGGEHANKLNLKLSGLTPIVDGARVMALDLGIETTNTLERLAAIEAQGIIKKELAADLVEAFSFITLLRISRHLEARAEGRTPDNFVDPESLNNFQRKMLKESFKVVNELQSLLEQRYQTRLIT